MCTDIDDAESMYNPSGDRFVASYYYRRDHCKNCNGRGYTEKRGLFLIQCKKCEGTGKIKGEI